MTTEAPVQVASKAGWKKASTHTITLPSGEAVEIRLPNLPEMIKSGVFPNNLLPIAIKRVKEEDIDVDKIKDLADYHRFLVTKMVVKPAVELEDIPDLPAADLDMLISFANRERDTDAIGHQLGGLETHEAFRKFRGLDRGDETLFG